MAVRILHEQRELDGGCRFGLCSCSGVGKPSVSALINQITPKVLRRGQSVDTRRFHENVKSMVIYSKTGCVDIV